MARPDGELNSDTQGFCFFVMTGLVPTIHVFADPG
ncbi:hypothetical protein J2Y55_003483 [Bosea sp. BE125]|nr:hypothetical protein [Bosea sp. BE125]